MIVGAHDAANVIGLLIGRLMYSRMESPMTQQRRHLDPMLQTPSKLQLRNIDGDARCDVAPKARTPLVPSDKYSKRGTGPRKLLFMKTQ